MANESAVWGFGILIFVRWSPLFVLCSRGSLLLPEEAIVLTKISILALIFSAGDSGG